MYTRFQVLNNVRPFSANDDQVNSYIDCEVVSLLLSVCVSDLSN